MKGIRTIAVGALARVEGEGALRVRIRDGAVEIVEFNIYEPPRFFEKLVVGRSFTEVPDIVARICGICPVAYQMTACRALERALGTEVSPGVRALRRLLYHGEWIQSHALHVHLLHLPDFLGFESGFTMAATHPALVESGFRMKALGNRIMEVVGGRAVHPVNVAVGGFHAWPDPAAVRGLVPDLERGLADALVLVERTGALDFPPFPATEAAVEAVCLRPASGYPLDEGRIVSTDSLDIEAADFPIWFQESQVPWSTALHCLRMPAATPYLVGPLARLIHCRDRLPPLAAAAADRAGFGRGETSPFRAIIARAIEIAAAFEGALAIAREWETPPVAPRVEVRPRESAAAAATEAPRGLLWHRYALDSDGRVTAGTIIPPTSQNQARLEADLRAFLPGVLAADDAEVTLRCEQLVRGYDPCISCATHFLNVSLDRGGDR